jgi:small subunit ribosomal protein S17
MASEKTRKPIAKADSDSTKGVRRSSGKARVSRREVVGIVVSDKMQKTIVVRVDRKVCDPQYKKFVVRSRKVKAHDENNVAKIGDQVLLVESRPISKHKRWALKRVLRRDGELVKVNVAS